MFELSKSIVLLMFIVGNASEAFAAGQPWLGAAAAVVAAMWGVFTLIEAADVLLTRLDPRS